MAANPGAWGCSLGAKVDDGGIVGEGLFNLTVTDGSTNVSERFSAVTLQSSADGNRLDRVLERGSQLVRLAAGQLDLPTPAPGSMGVGEGGQDSAPLHDTDYLGDATGQTGLYAFALRSFQILCIPPDSGDGDTSIAVYQQAAQLCVDNDAMLILDPPVAWQQRYEQGNVAAISLADLGSYTLAQARASAVYFPRVIIADPLGGGANETVAASGFIAGVWASNDARAGVWLAPAGLSTALGGVIELAALLDDTQNGQLNPQGINALRSFPSVGPVVWGARTMRGADVLADQCKYIPSQRLLDYIEASLTLGTRWAIFQPNTPSLWTALQLTVSSFMSDLFTQGAFAGASASAAFFVICDATTTTPVDQTEGIVNVQIGFAPTYPAEFIVLTISQPTADAA